MIAYYIYMVILAVMSIVCFLSMGADKARAQEDLPRIPEARLFLLALLGGALGGWLGMIVFRHKTKKPRFSVGFPSIACLQLVAAMFLAAM